VAGQQRGVVAGARADLQHPVPGHHGELVEHGGHDGGLRRGADRPALGVALGHDGLVEIGVFRGDPGHEEVARHVTHGRGHGFADVLTLPQQRHHGFPLRREVHVPIVHVRRTAPYPRKIA
jgi:hypothetical protein